MNSPFGKRWLRAALAALALVGTLGATAHVTLCARGH